MPKNSNQSKASNYSIDFDGSSQFINLGAKPIVTGIFSISMWIKRNSTSVGDSNQVIIGKDGVSSNRVFNVYFQNIGGSISFWVSSTGAYSVDYRVDTSTLIDDTDWHHIVLINNGDSVNNQIFIDGVEASYASQKPGRSTLYDTELIITSIGGDSSTGNTYNFNGKIGPVSMFDYALTGSAITALYNSGIPANPLAVATPPVAYYDLGQGSAYASGSAGIIEPNLAAATGSTVFNFTGVNGVYVDAGNDSSINFTSSFSVGFWFKTSSTATMYTSHGATGDIKYFLQFGGSINRLRLQIYDGTGTVLQVDNTQSTFYNNNWHHLAFTTDGTTAANKVIIYFDGQPLSTTGTLPNNGIKSTAGSLKIGAYTTTQNTFDGQLSNFQTWNTELSSTQVETLYNNGTPLQSYTDIPQSDSLKTWYKLGLDTSFWNGSDWVIGEAQANYSSALNFDGVNDQIDFPDIAFLKGGGSSFAISCWVRTTSTSQVGYWSCRSANPDQMNLFRDTSRFCRFELKSSTGGDMLVRSDTVQIPDNTWTHISVTFDGTQSVATDKLKLYINGVYVSQVVTGSSTGLPQGSLTVLNYIGRTFTGLRQTGNMSNVAIWNSPLDASAITALYNNGTPEASISSSPQAWWKLDSTTITDSSGNGNTGTNIGTTVTNIQVSTLNGLSSGMDTTNLVPSNLIKSIPYSGYSMNFDAGDSDYIEIPNNSSLQFTDQLTFSCWVKADNVSGTNTILDKFYDGADRSYVLRITSTTIRLSLGSTDGSSSTEYRSATTLSNDIWYNIITIFNGTDDEVNIYINGISDANNPHTKSDTISTNTQPLRIGAGYNLLNYFDGIISNVAVWNRAITQDEILRVYNGGSPGDLSNLGPTSWWSLGVDSYFNGSDWICPDLSTNSNNGTSANMGAANLLGIGPDSLANGTSTNLDLATDLIGEAPGSTGNAISINMNSLARTRSTP